MNKLEHIFLINNNGTLSIIVKNSNGIFEFGKTVATVTVKGNENRWQNMVEVIDNVKPIKGHEWIPIKKLLFMKLDKKLKDYLLWKTGRTSVPQLVIFEGIDGCGKTTLCEEVKNVISQKGFKIKIAKPVTKLKDYKGSHDEYRIQRCLELVQRLHDIDDEDFLMVDKPPYNDYIYKKIPEFKEHYNMPWYNWHQVEKAMYSEYWIVENAIKIWINNCNAKRNYFENNHSGNYALMKKSTYDKMNVAFEQGVPERYDSKEKLFKITCTNQDKKEVVRKITRIIIERKFENKKGSMPFIEWYGLPDNGK